jgi:hypothetical protein
MRFKVLIVDLDRIIRRWEGQDVESNAAMDYRYYNGLKRWVNL